MVRLSPDVLAVRAPADRSPSGDFSIAPEEGRLVLRRGQMRCPLGAVEDNLIKASVSDAGDVALLHEHEGREGSLSVNGLEVARATSIETMDLSADGSTVAYGYQFEVRRAGATGSTTLGKLTGWVERVEYLPGKRILARVDRNPWGIAKVPHYYIFEPDGRMAVLEDVLQAEALGDPVREPLRTTFATLFPGLSSKRAEELVDTFGYDVPSTRILSPSKGSAVFSGQHGIFTISLPDGRLEPGPEGKLSNVVWSGQETPAMLLSTEAGQRVAVEGSVLPYALGTAKPAWSSDGRYLAVEARESNLATIFCYDREEKRFFPVARGELTGWRGGQITARRDGVDLLCDPLPLGPEAAGGYLLGEGRAQPGSIDSDGDIVDVGGVLIPVQK